MSTSDTLTFLANKLLAIRDVLDTAKSGIPSHQLAAQDYSATALLDVQARCYVLSRDAHAEAGRLLKAMGVTQYGIESPIDPPVNS